MTDGDGNLAALNAHEDKIAKDEVKHEAFLSECTDVLAEDLDRVMCLFESIKERYDIYMDFEDYVRSEI